MLRHRQRITFFILGVWLLYPPVYYVMVSMDRYRYPILWTSLLPAGYFLAWLTERNAVSPQECHTQVIQDGECLAIAKS
jgi:hypothetical protein